ncbi:MAG: VWA domain-containing protein [Acidobacteriota bacterium]
MNCRVMVVALLFLVGPGRLSALDPVQERTRPVLGGGFTVLVDAVITDGNNHVVKDIRAEELEIWEDGVLQKIDACRFLGREEQEVRAKNRTVQRPSLPAPGMKPGEDQRPGTLANYRQPRRIIALLLDYGGADLTGQSLIDKACLKFIESDLDEQDAVAIFALDPGFRLLSDFTSDKAALKKALNRRRLSGVALHRINPRDLKDLLPWTPSLAGDEFHARQLLSSGAMTAGARDSGDPYPDLPADINIERPPQVGGGFVSWTSLHVRNVIGMFMTMVTQLQRGQANEHLAALRAILAGLGAVEGRKAVILFSPGVVIDSTNEPELHRTISAANRSGVVVYSIDPQGLETRGTSSSYVPRGELAYIGSAHQGPEAVSGESVFDRARTAGSDARDSLLRYLAAQTGGFAIRNTNDLYPGLSRIKEEIESCYLLSYRPERQTYDGLYRKLEVRCRRPGLAVRYRPGYVALPKGYETLTSEEFKLVQAAEEAAGAPNWPVFVEADVFHPQVLGPNVLVTVDVPFRQLRLVEEASNERSKQNRGRLKSAAVYLVGLLRDSTGAVLQRFGEPINLHLDSKRIAELRDGHVSFTFELTLLPGRYSLLVYAADRHAPEHHALVEQTVSVGPYSDELQASSLVVGRHVGRTREAVLASADGIKLSPSAERAFRPGERAVAFFRLYNFGVDAQAYCDLDVTFTLRRPGSEDAIQTRPFRLSEKCTENRDLPVMRFLELAGLPRGAYVLEARVEDKLRGSSISRLTRLTVSP